MKLKFVLPAASALLLSLHSFAQTTPEAPACIKASLERYIELGATGCTFNGSLYRDFTYSTSVSGGVPVTAGVTPADITVTPILFPTPVPELFPGLNFSAPWSVAADQSERSVIGYSVVPYPPVVLPATGLLTLDLGPSQVSGIIGSVTVQETATDSASASGLATTIEVYDICEDACRLQQTEETTISPLQALQTTLVVSLSGGTGGVSLQSFAADDAFGPQPQ
jgi:hypothetical protein